MKLRKSELGASLSEVGVMVAFVCIIALAAIPSISENIGRQACHVGLRLKHADTIHNNDDFDTADFSDSLFFVTREEAVQFGGIDVGCYDTTSGSGLEDFQQFTLSI